VHSVNILDLFLWCPILVLVLAILSFVGKGPALLVGLGVSVYGWRFYFPTFLGLMGCLLEEGALKWPHQVTGLWAVFGSFCPQGRLQLGLEVTLPVCSRWSDLLLFSPCGSCICPTTATLSGQLLLWQGGAILFEYCPQSYETSSVIRYSPTRGGWFVTPPLLPALVPCPISAHWMLGSSGRLTCHPTPTLRLCSLSHPHLLGVQLLAPPPFSEAGSEFDPTLTVSVRLQFVVYAFQFCSEGDSICPGAALDYILCWWVGESHMGCDPQDTL
jgi:hypothetical protein